MVYIRDLDKGTKDNKILVKWDSDMWVENKERGVSTDNINNKNLVKFRPNKSYMSIMCGSKTSIFYDIIYWA